MVARLRIYNLDDLPATEDGWTYSELSRVEISSRTQHPPSTESSVTKVSDLKQWVEAKMNNSPSQQAVYFHCAGAVNDTKPCRYSFEQAMELNEDDEMPLKRAVAAYYHSRKMSKSAYAKRWIGVRLIQQHPSDSTAKQEPTSKRARRR